MTASSPIRRPSAGSDPIPLQGRDTAGSGAAGMTAASGSAIEVEEGGVRKSLALSLVRQNRSVSLSLTFDRRYRRGILLGRAHVLALRDRCDAALLQMPEETA